MWDSWGHRSTPSLPTKTPAGSLSSASLGAGRDLEHLHNYRPPARRLKAPLLGEGVRAPTEVNIPHPQPTGQRPTNRHPVPPRGGAGMEFESPARTPSPRRREPGPPLFLSKFPAPPSPRPPSSRTNLRVEGGPLRDGSLPKRGEDLVPQVGEAGGLGNRPFQADLAGLPPFISPYFFFLTPLPTPFFGVRRGPRQHYTLWSSGPSILFPSRVPPSTPPAYRRWGRGNPCSQTRPGRPGHWPPPCHPPSPRARPGIIHLCPTRFPPAFLNGTPGGRGCGPPVQRLISYGLRGHPLLLLLPTRPLSGVGRGGTQRSRWDQPTQ